MVFEHLNINYCKYVKMLYLKYIFKRGVRFFEINYMEEELKAIVNNSTAIKNIIINNDLDYNILTIIKDLFYEYRAIIRQEKGFKDCIRGIE